MSETPAAAPGRVARAIRWPVDRLTALIRGIGRALPRAIEDLFHDRCPQYAASISFHVLFSLFPLTIARKLAEASWYMLTRNQPFAPAGATRPLAA